MAKERGISKTLFRLAIRNETDGAQLYQELADRAAAPLAKAMFASFVKDEQRHLEVVKAIFEGATPGQAGRRFRPGMPAKRLQSVFEKFRGAKGAERFPALATDVDALLLALEMEKMSFQLYRDEAAKVTGEAERKILIRLAAEENEHYEILSNTVMYLTDSGNWFIYKDHGIMDGG
jgi:rubrerythrin